jgi:hypothetical protein
MSESDAKADWWSLDHRLQSDLAFFEDYSKWSAYRLIRSSRELLEAFEASESRDERKDFAACLSLNHREALETFGALCHGLRSRGNGPAIRGILHCQLSQARGVLQSIRSQQRVTFANFLKLEKAFSADDSVPEEYDGDLDSFCEERRQGLVTIATIAAQSTLFQFYTPGSGRYLLIGSGRTVSEIKSGIESEMRSESTSGFFLVDISSTDSVEEPDLLAIAALAVPGVLRSSVDEIDFMAHEGSSIASLAASLARSGHLYADTSD